jgi:hypothetical protein
MRCKANREARLGIATRIGLSTSANSIKMAFFAKNGPRRDLKRNLIWPATGVRLYHLRNELDFRYRLGRERQGRGVLSHSPSTWACPLASLRALGDRPGSQPCTLKFAISFWLLSADQHADRRRRILSRRVHGGVRARCQNCSVERSKQSLKSGFRATSHGRDEPLLRLRSAIALPPGFDAQRLPRGGSCAACALQPGGTPGASRASPRVLCHP